MVTRSEIGRVASGDGRGEDLMATAAPAATLLPSPDVPFDKLNLSQSNVRRIKVGVSIEDLTEDIARRGLLQSQNNRPMIIADGVETCLFEIPAGGRHFKALALLVKQKRLAKTKPIPCITRDPGPEIQAKDDSLAENSQRAALHPLNQFCVFQTLREKGQGDDGRWLEDPALLDRLVAEKIQAEAEGLTSEGRTWIELAIGEGIIVNEYTFTNAGRRFG